MDFDPPVAISGREGRNLEQEIELTLDSATYTPVKF